jgi:glutathionylspermidine synthase
VIRRSFAPRPQWESRCEGSGFTFHSIDGGYWEETVAYEFTESEITTLESATQEVYSLCMKAAEHVIQKKRFQEFQIPQYAWEMIYESWEYDHPSLYGRFDFSYSGMGEPKLLEYNADTPTALLEASVIQWEWFEDRKANFPTQADQFNSIHEKLLLQWRWLAEQMPSTSLYFSCVKDHEEDHITVDYLRDTAMQAGVNAPFLFTEDIGWEEETRFVDLNQQTIRVLFKLYPWEWLLNDAFGAHLAKRKMQLIEPAWKMLLSNKALLPILWELFPNHPNLLRSSFSSADIGSHYVKKPLLSREGANIEIVAGSQRLTTDGPYGEEGFVYQDFEPLPEFSGRYPVIGSWIIGDEPAGIGIREDDSLITKNTSKFVPHYFLKD